MYVDPDTLKELVLTLNLRNPHVSVPRKSLKSPSSCLYTASYPRTRPKSRLASLALSVSSNTFRLHRMSSLPFSYSPPNSPKQTRNPHTIIMLVPVKTPRKNHWTCHRSRPSHRHRALHSRLNLRANLPQILPFLVSFPNASPPKQLATTLPISAPGTVPAIRHTPSASNAVAGAP